MAQFYQVVNHDEKLEEVTQFYQKVEDSEPVQYLIASSDNPQQFQAQPVVVSSDQLMVVEGQGQQVIIDQSQVAYSSSQYVIQGAQAIDFQNNTQQQVYYMTDNTQNQSVIVEQPITQQPVVLNHQMMQNHIAKVNTGIQSGCSPVLNTSPLQEKNISTLQQIRTQLKTQVARHIMTPRTIQKVSTASGIQYIHNSDGETSRENNETVTLPDGTVITVGQYRKIVVQQKFNQAAEQGVVSTNVSNVIQRRSRQNSSPIKGRNIVRQPRQQARLNTSFSQNSTEDSSLEESAVILPKPNIPQQMPRQQRSTQQMPQSQSQYLIQPRSRDSKPPAQRPLPQFLHSTQIQNIIDRAPKNEEYTDSIRMLVVLDNGEQRLITFTLPKEACTIQEILEQVGVPLAKDTPIQVSEANWLGLNYIVGVGNIPDFATDIAQQETISEPEYTVRHQTQQSATQTSSHLEVQKAPPSPERSKDSPPRLVEGQLALCGICGYLSEDFNRCIRCKRKLPENVKSIPGINSNGKKIDPRGGLADKRLNLQKANGVPRMNLLPKRRPPRSKLMECETVVVSSDEEDGETSTPVKNVSEQLLEKLGASVTISPISKEPSLVDIQKANIAALKAEKVQLEHMNSTLILCRTIRIGSYRFVPPEPVRIDSNYIFLKVPHPKCENTIKHIKIETCDIVKVLVSFQKSLPVIFYYLLPSVGVAVRTILDMTSTSDYYFDPLSELEESHRRITLLPEALSEECKTVLQKMYCKPGMLEDLTYKEANEILIKTCPKELSKVVLNYSNIAKIKPILMYPPEGRGKITINTEDYMCLGQDQFLNDVIIDFYLKYLLLNLPKEQQEKVHIFSTFFYKRLTTKPLKASKKSQPNEVDPNLTPAQKRHSRVKTWTKDVNIFDKDFIVVPINENCHWFLAIICFPSMNGCQTMDGVSVKIEPKQTKLKKKSCVKETKADPSIMCDEVELSDKDEAEGDDSELDSDDSEENATLSVENNEQRPPIKQPCILIFDSLPGASRSRVVATLRDYLTCEHKAKLDVDKIFTKDVIKGACPKVPQQSNFTDCGLYLLQYVEQFFKEPIKDYYIPISHLKTWFEEITVTRKREDISLLIQTLMTESGKDLSILPDVVFPTLNGELVERSTTDSEDKFIDPDEELMEEEDEDYVPSVDILKQGASSSETNSEGSPQKTMKPSCENAKSNNEFTEESVTPSLLKPNLSELPKQSNRDTLSYLKAKRILRHKNNAAGDGPPAIKKLKSESDTI